MNNTDDAEVVYVLGYWCNPYRADREYYWFRCYEGMKEARNMGALKQKRGQPKNFTNWVKGSNSYFTNESKFLSACAKAGIKPRLD